MVVSRKQNLEATTCLDATVMGGSGFIIGVVLDRFLPVPRDVISFFPNKGMESVIQRAITNEKFGFLNQASKCLFTFRKTDGWSVVISFLSSICSTTCVSQVSVRKVHREFSFV